MGTPAGKGGGRNGGGGGRLTVDHPTAPSSPLSIAELSGVREVYWSLARQGHRLPAQRNVILIDGGKVRGDAELQSPIGDLAATATAT